MIQCLKNDFGILTPDIKIGPAKWPHFDLIVVHSGKIKLQLNSKQISINTGQAILLHPETRFHGDCETPEAKISVHHFRLNDHNHLPKGIRLSADKKSTYKLFQQYNVELEQDIERIIDLAHALPRQNHDTTRSILMLLILSQLQSDSDRQVPPAALSPELEKLIDWLNENMAKNITLNDMARQTGMSTSHFRSLFKKQTGTSPGTWLLNLRINKAAKLLRETTVPIKNIPEMTGYNTITYFYNAFKTRYKMTPKTYRNHHMARG